MTREISEARKASYYFGMILMAIGVLMFASTFVTFAMNFGNFHNIKADVKSGMFRAFGGMALLMIGGIIRGLGARGLAGSGAVLDPEQAREDLEPYTRMAGGMLKDGLDESGISLGQPPAEKVIMIKCPRCGKLNDEDSKFCQECGGSFNQAE